MDLPTTVNLFFSIMVVLCVALVVYGGWVSLNEAQGNSEKAHHSGMQPAGSILPPQPETYQAAAGLAVPAPEDEQRLGLKPLYACLALAGIIYALVLNLDVVPTGSPVSAAAATEATTQSRASIDYFPANYVNQGRDGDGNVMTYEHD